MIGPCNRYVRSPPPIHGAMGMCRFPGAALAGLRPWRRRPIWRGHVPSRKFPMARHHHPVGPQGRRRWSSPATARSRFGKTVVKSNAKKVRRLGQGDVIAGFAGATADAFTLFERLEAKLEQHPGPADPRLRRAGQGLAHRPLSAPARGDDGGRRQAGEPGADRHRRRAGARGRADRHRLGRQLRAWPRRAR